MADNALMPSSWSAATGAAPAPSHAALHWVNRYARLGADFSTVVMPQGLHAPHWVHQNTRLAQDLGLDPEWLKGDEALQVFSGHALLAGMQPVATVYSGHQFGVWAGQLGDGRALLLGEAHSTDPHSPWPQFELQLKGSGRTPYSRMGDGLAVLRSSIREYLCSEAMHALGVPTTRALTLTGAQHPVRRERIETAAVVSRVAPSFLRFGHFEHFARQGQHEALGQLVDMVLAQHMADLLPRLLPHGLSSATPAQRALALLSEVSQRTAELMADWQSLGFCHGVMNTDNMSILGLTLDYGPFGFMDGFNPQHICNHSDVQGRYAYDQQAQIAYWNLHALAQALMPLIQDVEAAQATLAAYPQSYLQAWQKRFARKLGLNADLDVDLKLIQDWLSILEKEELDFTWSHRQLPDVQVLRDHCKDRSAFEHWAARYLQRLDAAGPSDGDLRKAMHGCNPKFILRNHLAQLAIEQAEQGDMREVERLFRILQRPYDEQPENDAYAAPAPAWAKQLEVSCSS